jgi:iron complex outermembrane recepter protein
VRVRPSAVRRVLLTFAAACAATAALADEEATLPQVLVQGDAQSASVAALDVGSPQSVVSSQLLQRIASPVGDYGSVANFTPSYVSSAPNGPGFDAAKNQTLRGFVDGQFNVTLDGIPFGDPDNFQHHSTSFFPTSELEQMVIDRSPGGAPDLGYASFGGSINLFSTAIPEAAHARLFADYGSFNTRLFGAALNTAAPQVSGQTGFLMSLQHAESDGALSYSAGYKNDLLLKAASWLGEARITALYAYDSYHFYNPGSITTTDLALFGSSFGYNDDPTSPDYYGYSNTHRAADFGYLRAELPFASAWRLQETLYTFSYRNQGLSLKGDQTSSPLGAGFPGFDPTDLAGRLTEEAYTTVGNDLRVASQGAHGLFLAGLWAEHGWQSESRVAVDLTTGSPYDANRRAASPVYFDFDAHLDTVQPYAEYAWQLSDAWTMRFGMRYRVVTRDFDATAIQNFLPGTNGTVSRRVSGSLPSFDTSYRLAEDTSVYAQLSRGSLTPSQAFFYTANPALGNQVNPETAVAAQLGIVRQTDRLGLGLDAYSINFNNYVSTVTRNGETLYVNSGRVLYRGIETEDHWTLGAGVTLVLNASLIRATFQDSGITSPIQMAGQTIPYAPAYTGLCGLTYGAGPWGASLLAKLVGTEYQGKNGSADGATYRVNSYSYTNATLTRTFSDWLGTHNLRLTFAANNLWNSGAVTDNAGPSIAGPNLVNVLPRRNYMLSVVADL